MKLTIFFVGVALLSLQDYSAAFPMLDIDEIIKSMLQLPGNEPETYEPAADIEFRNMPRDEALKQDDNSHYFDEDCSRASTGDATEDFLNLLLCQNERPVERKEEPKIETQISAPPRAQQEYARLDDSGSIQSAIQEMLMNAAHKTDAPAPTPAPAFASLSDSPEKFFNITHEPSAPAPVPAPKFQPGPLSNLIDAVLGSAATQSAPAIVQPQASASSATGSTLTDGIHIISMPSVIPPAQPEAPQAASNGATLAQILSAEPSNPAVAHVSIVLSPQQPNSMSNGSLGAIRLA